MRSWKVKEVLTSLDVSEFAFGQLLVYSAWDVSGITWHFFENLFDEKGLRMTDALDSGALEREQMLRHWRRHFSSAKTSADERT